jgi:hypothetical protein
VQDRYAGDLGDFLKFGLLRQLATGDDCDPPLRLGVVWYRTADESHNADGKHVGYLAPSHRIGQHLRSLDPDLYDRLAAVVAAGERSIPAGVGVLAEDTAYFSDLLDLSGLSVSARTARSELRTAWVEGAVARTAGCELVFGDPDNGLRTRTHKVARHRTKAVKHAYVDELLPYAQRRQSIIAYHHADRSATVEVQAQRRLAELAEVLPLRPLAAVRASRGTTRLFLVVAASARAARLEKRLSAIEASAWRDELGCVVSNPQNVSVRLATPAHPRAQVGVVPGQRGDVAVCRPARSTAPIMSMC